MITMAKLSVWWLRALLIKDKATCKASNSALKPISKKVGIVVRMYVRIHGCDLESHSYKGDG